MPDLQKPLLRLFLFMELDMKIVINGDQMEITGQCTVSELLEQLKLPAERVAVEVNMEIIPKIIHKAHLISDGDKIEIVHFVGGG